MRRISLLLTVFTAVAACSGVQLGAQEAGSESSHPARPILSIGNYPRVDGLRLNFRDSGLERVNGINVTAWSPYEPASGTVSGVALGLPMTGAANIRGLAAGVFGVAADHDISGIMLAPIGAGAGNRVRGIAIAGIGVGAGGSLEGIVVGGIGAGSGGDARGLILGGVGAAAGGNIHGIAAGGIGAAAGGSVQGLVLGGIGAAAGGSLRGLALGGIGAAVGRDLEGIGVGGIGIAAGGDITGVALSGIGVAAGSKIHGLAIAGVGVAAPRLEGGIAALLVGGKSVNAVVLAPAMFRIEPGGEFHGGSLSALNYIRGTQTGITIGLLNYARSLHGAQVGVINIVADQKAHPVLPILNWGH